MLFLTLFISSLISVFIYTRKNTGTCNIADPTFNAKIMVACYALTSRPTFYGIHTHWSSFFSQIIRAITYGFRMFSRYLYWALFFIVVSAIIISTGNSLFTLASVPFISIPSDLINLRSNVESGQINDKDLLEIAEERCGNEISEKILMFLETRDLDLLNITALEALHIWTYSTKHEIKPVLIADKKTDIRNNRKVILDYTNRIVKSNAIEDDADSPDFVGVYYDRTWIPGITRMVIQEPVMSVWSDELQYSKDEAVFASDTLSWEGERLIKLVQLDGKAFYAPSIPSIIKDWAENCTIKLKNDLGVFLKRPGKLIPGLSIDLITYKTFSLNNIPSGFTSKAVMKVLGGLTKLGLEFNPWDLGVLVLSMSDWEKIESILGTVITSPLQGTGLGQDFGFKGVITNTQISHLEAGVYGGIKGINKTGVLKYVSVMSVLDAEPWKTSLNRQITDYIGIQFPSTFETPDQDMFTKRFIGLEAHEIRFRNTVIKEGLDNSLNKIKLNNSSYFGKVHVRKCNSKANFRIRSSRIKENKVIPMALLIFPWLPIYTKVMQVQIELVPDTEIENHRIELVFNLRNLSFISYWFISYWGRDLDGDGIGLTTDPRIMLHAEPFTNLNLWTATTTAKVEMVDYPAKTWQIAVNIAAERAALGQKLIGKYDKLARRIIYLYPEKMTMELRRAISTCIQMAISSQKKNVNPKFTIDDNDYKWRSTSWIKYAGFLTEKEYAELFKYDNEHDILDNMSSMVKGYLKHDTIIRKLKKSGKYTDSLGAEQEARWNSLMAQVSRLDFNTQLVIFKYLGLLNYPIENDEMEFLKAISRDNVMECRQTLSMEDRNRLNICITKIRALSATVTRSREENPGGEQNHGISYSFIEKLMRYYIHSENDQSLKKALISGFITSLPEFFIGFLAVKDLQAIGYKPTIYLPVKHAPKIGDTLTIDQLMAKIPIANMFRIFGNGYVVKSVRECTYQTYFTSAGNMQGSNYMAELGVL